MTAVITPLMPALRETTLAAMIIFIAVLAALVGARLLSGEINTRGLLRRKGSRRDVGASPERVQLLLSTMAMAGTYLGRVLTQRSSGELPDVPGAWLGALGASHVLYLGTKLWATGRPARSTRPATRRRRRRRVVHPKPAREPNEH